MTTLAWGNKVSPAFVDRMLAMCNKFAWTWQDAPSDIMGCMAFESGETFSPSIVNMAGSGATGLIQFMPATAIGLGTTVQQLSRMTAVEQLGYVEKYFKPYASRVKGLSDMYMAILLPSFIGKSDFAALFTQGTTAYRQNAALDADTNGLITKAEATAMVLKKKTKGLQPPYVLTR